MKPTPRTQRLAALLIASAAAFLITVAVRNEGQPRSLRGSLAPPSSPGATSYTLSDIYTRLTTNETATAGDHAFVPGAEPAETLHTLTEIYDAVPTIDGSKLLSGTTYLGVAGTIETQTLSDSSTTVEAGYYEATTLDAVDGDLAAANILAGNTIFGVAGSASAGADLSDMFNGTGQGFDGGTQANGGVDDSNGGGSAPNDRYEGTWTQCDAGNNYCGTGDGQQSGGRRGSKERSLKRIGELTGVTPRYVAPEGSGGGGTRDAQEAATLEKLGRYARPQVPDLRGETEVSTEGGIFRELYERSRGVLRREWIGSPRLRQAAGDDELRSVLSQIERAVKAGKPPSRAEALAALAASLGLAESSSAPSFTDVPPSHSYAREIAAAEQLHIATLDVGPDGKPTGLLKPDDPLTRDDMEKLVRVLRRLNYLR